MHDKILAFVLMIITPMVVQAQFHTITKESEIDYSREKRKLYSVETQDSTLTFTDTMPDRVPSSDEKGKNSIDSISSPKCNDYALPKSRYEYAKARGRKPRSEQSNKLDSQTSVEMGKDLPELTLPNLYAEIKKNNIKYPKIVLAQAILETGWFKSSVCRNKHNLFGLTNPRTKTYYEFDHWTESVAAYKSKVQYRYKGGNYLLWLRNIGYAEDKGYIQAVIRVLKQL